MTVSEEKEESPLTSVEQQENGEAGETGSQVLEESADDPSPATETDNLEQQGDSSADANALQQTNQHCPATANHEQVAPWDLEHLSDMDIPSKNELARSCKILARLLHARLAWHVHAICPFS